MYTKAAQVIPKDTCWGLNHTRTWVFSWYEEERQRGMIQGEGRVNGAENSFGHEKGILTFFICPPFLKGWFSPKDQRVSPSPLGFDFWLQTWAWQFGPNSFPTLLLSCHWFSIVIILAFDIPSNFKVRLPDCFALKQQQWLFNPTPQNQIKVTFWE